MSNSIHSNNNIHRNLPVSQLYVKCIQNNCIISSTGALVAYSGIKTGRSANDKRFVLTDPDLWIENSPNKSITLEDYNINKKIAKDFLKNSKDLYIFDGFAGWDKEHQIKLRVYTTNPYHALFCNNIFIRPTENQLKDFEPEYIIYNAGKCYSDDSCKSAPSKTNIMLNIKDKEIYILGTEYAGEMKKGIFTIFNYIMPKKDILSLHSSVNFNEDNVSIFFGLSGTGKTTLSSDPKRILIGDDEHCWTDNGVFNIEGGCYAKCINLNKTNEKDIYDAIKYGTVLENVILDKNDIVDYKNTNITANTRACYPINVLNNVKIPCKTSHPNNIILLTCDAFGLLPLVSKLSINEALYYFINGYTSKVAGTEIGIDEPIATFSSCFGEAFLPLHPLVYANLLKKKLEKHNTNCWLVNTGWVNGGYGNGGYRCDLSFTRKIIDNIHNGELNNMKFETLPVFNLKFPSKCGDIPTILLNPMISYGDIDGYIVKLKKLGKKFIDNFKRFNIKDEEILNCNPVI
tara:strand:- start:253 stop:1800 length:1548 start_codon:yes stop_codon:yes gene_type:complete